jgi:hypothetical protein
VRSFQKMIGNAEGDGKWTDNYRVFIFYVNERRDFILDAAQRTRTMSDQSTAVEAEVPRTPSTTRKRPRDTTGDSLWTLFSESPKASDDDDAEEAVDASEVRAPERPEDDTSVWKMIQQSAPEIDCVEEILRRVKRRLDRIPSATPTSKPRRKPKPSDEDGSDLEQTYRALQKQRQELQKQYRKEMERYQKLRQTLLRPEGDTEWHPLLWRVSPPPPPATHHPSSRRRK